MTYGFSHELLWWNHPCLDRQIDEKNLVMFFFPISSWNAGRNPGLVKKKTPFVSRCWVCHVKILWVFLGSQKYPNFWHQRGASSPNLNCSSKRKTWIQIPQQKWDDAISREISSHFWPIEISIGLDIWPTWCPYQGFHLPNTEVSKNTNHTTLPPHNPTYDPPGRKARTKI